MSEKMLVKDVIFREDLYPRFESNQVLIERYSNAVDNLPPIMVNQNNILIDGFHRWKAHQMADHDEIAFELIETASEADLEVLAYRYNSRHGAQLSSDEKAAFAQKKVELLKVKDIADILSVSIETVNTWTKNQRAAIKKKRNRKIRELYLRAWNTQRDVAKILKIDHSTVGTIMNNLVDSTEITKIHQEFEPKLYNIWNMPKADKETKHFGYFPEEFMANILYYHTEPLDIVYDPFAGSGTTVDICKKWLRRYYCSDRIVTPGRELDIRQWDIVEGVPADIPKNKPVFVFLDPPYWIQAEGDKLKRIEGAIHWWLGDWLNYGERAYGEKYSQALDETEFSYKTLRTDSWVAHRIEVSRRRDNLSWSHHREVAPLDLPDQDRLLDQAESGGMSIRELRRAVDRPATAVLY